MRVLLVSGIDGFCHRYRTLHWAEQLALLGGGSTIRHFADPRLAAEVAAHDALVLYRVPATRTVATCIDLARAAAIPVVGCIDDLVFVDDPALFPDLARTDAAARDLWFDGLRRYRATLARCDVVAVTTGPLLAEARAAGWRATRSRNSASGRELDLGARAIAARAATRRALLGDRGGEGPLLGYFAGTATHDRDFAVAAGAVVAALDATPGARLLLVGPLDPGPALAADPRVRRLETVPWTELPGLVAACDLALAPLDLGSRFAAAKGEIKYLEAAAAGVPLVASASEAFRHAIVHDRTGWLVPDRQDWPAVLAGALADPARRARVGAAARADVVARFGPAARAREFAALLEEAAAARAAAAAVPRPPAVAGVDLRDVPAALVALEPDAYPGALRPAGAAFETPPLAAGHAVAQRFRALAPGLLRVDVHAVTYGLQGGGELEISLARESGSTIARTRVPVADLPDRAWVSLELPPQADSAGAVYECRLAVHGAPRDATNFGLAPCASGEEPAVLDGAPLAGRLAMRGFADWSLALAGAAVAAPPGRAA